MRNALELVWIGATVAALAQLHAILGRLRPPPSADGPDWSQYFAAGWKLVHGIAEDYPRFRLPLYPWLVATLGETTSYQAAAEGLSLASVVGCVVLAAVLARLLGGPWAAAVAPWVALYAPALAASSRWSSQYAPFALLVGLGVTSAVVAAGTGRVGAAAAAGVVAGLGWAFDVRGATVAVLGALLVLGGMRGGWRAVLAPAAFVAAFTVGPWIQGHLEVIPRPDAGSLVLEQRAMTLDEVWQPLDPAVRAACAGSPRTHLPRLDGLTGPCGRASLASNAATLARTLPGGGWGALLLTGLAVLAGRGVRDRWTTAVALGGPIAAVLLAAAWLPALPQRYLLVFVVPFVVVAPVAVGRVLGRLGNVGDVVAAVVTGVALFTFVGRPAEAVQGDLRNATVRAAIAALADRTLGADGALLDCTPDGKVGLSMAPRHPPADPADLGEHARPATCRAWLREPTVTPAARLDRCEVAGHLSAGWRAAGAHDGLCLSTWGGAGASADR